MESVSEVVVVAVVAVVEPSVVVEVAEEQARVWPEGLVAVAWVTLAALVEVVVLAG